MELVSQAGQAEEGISRELIKGIRLTSWRTQGRQGQAGREHQTRLSYKDGLCLNCSLALRPQFSSPFMLKSDPKRGEKTYLRPDS